jgi:hypothetical protein
MQEMNNIPFRGNPHTRLILGRIPAGTIRSRESGCNRRATGRLVSPLRRSSISALVPGGLTGRRRCQSRRQPRSSRPGSRQGTIRCQFGGDVSSVRSSDIEGTQARDIRIAIISGRWRRTVLG